MDKKTNINEMLSVIRSDVKKIITHFKIDRRKPGDDGGKSESQSDSDNAILENISSVIIEPSSRKLFTEGQIEQLKVLAAAVSDYFAQRQDKEQAELKSLLEVITKKLDEQQTAPQRSTTRHEHHFSVDFRNSKAALTMTVMAFIIITSLGLSDIAVAKQILEEICDSGSSYILDIIRRYV